MANVQFPSLLKLSMIQWPSYPFSGQGIWAHTVMTHTAAILDPLLALVHPFHGGETGHLRRDWIRCRDTAIPWLAVGSFWTAPDTKLLFWLLSIMSIFSVSILRPCSWVVTLVQCCAYKARSLFSTHRVAASTHTELNLSRYHSLLWFSHCCCSSVPALL